MTHPSSFSENNSLDGSLKAQQMLVAFVRPHLIRIMRLGWPKLIGCLSGKYLDD